MKVVICTRDSTKVLKASLSQRPKEFCNRGRGLSAAILQATPPLQTSLSTPRNVLPFYVTAETGAAECPGFDALSTPFARHKISKPRGTSKEPPFSFKA